MIFAALASGLLFFCGMMLLLWRLARRAEAEARAEGGGPSAQEFLGFEAVEEDGMVRIRPGEYRLILEVKPVNFWLLSGEEQRQVLLIWKAALDQQKDPLQIFVASLRTDPREPARIIRERSADAPSEGLRMLGEAMAWAVEEHLGSQTLYQRSCFLILSWSLQERTLPEGEIRALARKNLRLRAEALRRQLEPAGLAVMPLGEEEAMDFLQWFYLRDRAGWGKLSESVEEGVLSPITEAEEEWVYAPSAAQEA